MTVSTRLCSSCPPCSSPHLLARPALARQLFLAHVTVKTPTVARRSSVSLHLCLSPRDPGPLSTNEGSVWAVGRCFCVAATSGGRRLRCPPPAAALRVRYNCHGCRLCIPFCLLPWAPTTTTFCRVFFFKQTCWLSSLPFSSTITPSATRLRLLLRPPSLKHPAAPVERARGQQVACCVVVEVAHASLVRAQLGHHSARADVVHPDLWLDWIG